MQKIFILGSGGFAKELGSYYNKPSEIFYVDDHNKNEKIISLKTYKEIIHNDDISIMGSGKPLIKEKMLNEIQGKIGTYIHQQTVVYGKINEGCVIAPFSMVAPNSIIGKHVLINYGASCGHDCIIGNLSTISPHASIGGFCKIGNKVYIGSNVSIKEHLVIGDNSIIGMNAAITHDIPPNSIVIGGHSYIFTIDEWPIIKQRMSSNIRNEIEQIRNNNFKSL